MNRFAKWTCVALSAFAFGATAANAQTGMFDDRFYQVIVDDEISWQAADAAAKTMFHDYGAGDPRGIVQGRLATITSLGEDEFVDGIRGDTSLLAKPEVWVGGFQEDGATSPGAGWRWLNGEFIASSNTNIPYTNWQNGEPNDYPSGTETGTEQHIGVGHSGNFGWNDEGNTGNIGGYVVEYGDVTDPTVCLEGVIEDGCPVEGGAMRVILDADTDLPPDPFLLSKLEVFTDPRVDSNGDCIINRRPLDVYAELVPQPDSRSGSLIIDENHCGSPRFAVLKVDSNIDIISGVVNSEQIPEIVPGIGNVYACDGGGDLDLQHRSIFGYQTDNRFDLIEKTEIGVTSGCGSSRGKHRALSFFILNLHIDCGITDLDTDAILACFIDLSDGKLGNLDQSLKNAKSELTNEEYGPLRSRFSNAKARFGQGRYDEAIAELLELLVLIENTDFNTISGFNYQGDLIMRIENLIFNIEKIRDAS